MRRAALSLCAGVLALGLAGTAAAEGQGRAGWLDRLLDRKGEVEARERPNPNSNAQWLPDAKRGQERAAERRPAHAGPRHGRAVEGEHADKAKAKGHSKVHGGKVKANGHTRSRGHGHAKAHGRGHPKHHR